MGLDLLHAHAVEALKGNDMDLLARLLAADYLLDRGAQVNAMEPTACMPMRVGALHFTTLRDRQHNAQPDGWAEYNGHPQLAALIRAGGYDEEDSK